MLSHHRRPLSILLSRYLPGISVLLSIALAMLVTRSLVSTGIPYLTKKSIDQYIPTRNINGITELAGLCAVFLVTACVAELIQALALRKIAPTILGHLRSEAYRIVQRTDFGVLQHVPVSQTMSTIVSDVELIGHLFTAGVTAYIAEVISVIAVGIMMLALNWRLALLPLALLPITYTVLVKLRHRLRRLHLMTWEATQRVIDFIEDRVTASEVVILFNRQGTDLARFDALSKQSLSSTLQSLRHQALVLPICDAAGAVGLMMLILLGGRSLPVGAASVGLLLIMAQYSQRLHRPLAEVAGTGGLVQDATDAAERICRLFDLPQVLVPSTPVALDLTGVGCRIELREVSFAYDQRVRILDNVTWAVPPFERVGIVGPTGVGKTTLINLIVRLYDVNSGGVLVDGIDVKDVSPASLRRVCAVVSQEGRLWRGTLLDNLGGSRADVSADDIASALVESGAAPIVAKLPAGLLTVVGQDTTGLSMGEVQLLCLARVLATKPRAVLLDEATASVDSHTEGVMQRAILGPHRKSTVIVVAHRQSTLREVDVIYELRDGRITRT